MINSNLKPTNQWKLKSLIYLVNALLLDDNYKYVLDTSSTKIKFIFSVLKVFIIQ